MKQLKIGSWLIEVDVDRTEEFYKNYHLILVDCSCDYCANYVQACNTFSPEIKKLFNSFGIDPQKEGEVYELKENDDKTHVYCGFYHFIGKILEGPEDRDFVTIHGLEVAFTENVELFPENFPKPAVQLTFQVDIPWILH